MIGLPFDKRIQIVRPLLLLIDVSEFVDFGCIPSAGHLKSTALDYTDVCDWIALLDDDS